MGSSRPEKSKQAKILHAARTGQVELFDELLVDGEIDIVNLTDSGGYSLLDYAAYYDETMSAVVIRNKKRIVRKLLEKHFTKDSPQFKKTLNLIAQKGCYQTGKELLSTRDIEMSDLQPAFNLAGQNGHQRVSHAIMSYGNQDAKTKIKANPLFQDVNIKEPLIIADAKNLNLNDDDFLQHLKKAGKIEFDINGKTVNAIDLRVESLRKRYRSKSLKKALLGALCPAMALAVFLATFGGFFPNPLLTPVLTIALLPIIYLPMAFITYKAAMKDYGSVSAETLNLNYQASVAAAKRFEFDEKLTNIATRLEQFKKEFAEHETPELKANIEKLQLEYRQLKNEMTKTVEFSANKKPKFTLKYMTREKLKEKKEIALHDAKENSDWVSTKEKIRAFAGYSAEVLCAVDGGLALGGAITAIVMSKVGLGFLGVAAVGFLTGPIGISVVVASAAVMLAIAFGVILYKSSYSLEKEELGKLNRELVMASDACKLAADFGEVNKKANTLDADFATLKSSLEIKAIASRPSSPSKLVSVSDHPNAMFGDSKNDDRIEPPKPFVANASLSRTMTV